MHSSFTDILLRYGCAESQEISPYSPNGTLFTADTEFYQGTYWLYAHPDFYIDIHNFRIKKDYIMHSVEDLPHDVRIVSAYLISGHGEWFHPYQNLEGNTLFSINADSQDNGFILHGNTSFFMVSIKLKSPIIEEVMNQMNSPKEDFFHLLLSTQKQITLPIKKIAKDILSCHMEGPSADFFFEGKVKEWISLVLHAYGQLKSRSIPDESDQIAIRRVARYIDDHYPFTIPQSLLERIAAMSGTKLKNTFKACYHMSITEYTQRKRMNMAETLLLSTDLPLKSIAESVGYHAPARFSALFKRYKGLYPKDIRKRK